MKYIKEVNDFEKALSINETQAEFIKSVIQKAYNQECHKDGPNVDQINALVAPHINTPEEAFYAGQIIMLDVLLATKGK